MENYLKQKQACAEAIEALLNQSSWTERELERLIREIWWMYENPEDGKYTAIEILKKIIEKSKEK